MQDKNLVLALNISERIDLLKKEYPSYSTVQKQAYKNWVARKSLVKEELHQEILKNKGYSEKEFSVGIKKLSAADIPLLYSFLVQQSWYQNHTEVMKEVADIDGEEEYSIYLRPYESWMKNRLIELKNACQFKIEDSVIKTITESYVREVLNISLKTLVYDLNEFFEDQPEQIDKKQKYYTTRFEDTESYQHFFNDYPVLARLIATRAIFFVKNIQEFFEALSNTTSDEWQRLGVTLPITLEKTAMDKGDSHGKGKSVILTTINGKHLVFKYKNLLVAERFDQFCQVIHSLDDRFSFKSIKRIVKANYTFEEFIDYKACDNEKAVALYYRRFGQLIALAHFLRGSDFHLENVIVHGDFPVLIDVETLIQNAGNNISIGKAVNYYIKNQHESILNTCLLPGIQKKTSENLELSGLDGDEQPLPKKVLQLVEEDDGRIHMEYLSAVMAGSNNVPMVDGKKVSWANYKKEITQGFSEMYQFFMKNKKDLIRLSEYYFSGLTVRNVLKSTEKYAEMLDYGYHPSYMTNYIHREKLFENLWGYNYRNNEVIPAEIEDLLVNDIPIFFNQTTSEKLMTSSFEALSDFYEEMALDLVIKKINESSLVSYQQQLNKLHLALGNYDGNERKYKLDKRDPIDAAFNLIQNQMILGDDEQDLILTSYIFESEKCWKRNPMNFNFYDGYAGVYAFTNALGQENFQAEKVANAITEMIPQTHKEIENAEQYASALGKLYILSKQLENGKSIDIDNLQQLFEVIHTFYKQNSFTNEWLFGRASLLKLCLNFYKQVQIPFVSEFTKNIIQDIQFEKMDNSGFAHGYAGVTYALLDAQELFPKNEQLSEQLNAYLEALHGNYLEDNKRASWCNGLVGILFTINKVKQTEALSTLFPFSEYEKLINNLLDNQYQDSDGLCHGNSGILALLNTIYTADQDLTVDTKQKILGVRNKLVDELSTACYVQGLEREPACGLMNGLSGVGYELLRTKNPQMSNILLLE